MTILLLSLSVLVYGQDFRSFDGSLNHPDGKGSTGAPLIQFSTNGFSDGFSEPGGLLRANPRSISNDLFAQEGNLQDEGNRSDFLWVFGQFLDHDISLVSDDPNGFMMILTPNDDEIFGPGVPIPMSRSLPITGTGTEIGNPRQYSNEVTAFIDGSAIYGSDDDRAFWLRRLDGTGKLKTSEGDLLPWNTTDGEFNSNIDQSSPHMDDFHGQLKKYFVAGDVRANENPLLIAMHTVFVREHNRLCDEIVDDHPEWFGNDDLIFFTARKHLTAYLQSIVFYEWLPTQGVYLPEYSGYQESMDPSIMNVFSAAAFRMGHTLINSNIIRMDNTGSEINQGHMTLRDAFFNPIAINLAGGIEPYIKGMATQVQQSMDCKVIDDVRNFLFGEPGEGGLDLAAININRGRERGLSDYNTIREDFGKPRINSFLALTGDQDVADIMEDLYDDVDDIDPWVGMLAERHLPNHALFGDLMMTIMEEQFQKLREGDRFYFENDEFTIEELEEIRNTTLYDVIMRNSGIDIMQEDVFMAMDHSDIPTGPDLTNLALEAVAYPNPTTGLVHIKLYAESDNKIHLDLFDPIGRLVRSEYWDVQRGDNFMTMNLDEGLPRGMYNLMIESSNSFNILKIIKEK